ncbi:Nuclear factor related to kappa-B-binding protein [Sesamum alatum]|uniref:Nuclear factor related to kappa-B-binding protein n=1 Tax=Sesamum alatum TaxID=300844 RepID=A0AAE1XW69_9LAMI|nr:Nuclear factor related to kappa-B-binding protein [Sesamum alatum]
MPNFDAFHILTLAFVFDDLIFGPQESMEVQRGKTNFSDGILSEEELNAAEALYELANGLSTIMPETKLGKRKSLGDGSTRRSRRRVKCFSPVNADADYHDSSCVQDLCNNDITERLSRHRCLRTAPEKLSTGTSSKSRCSLVRSHLRPNMSSKTIEIPSGNGFELFPVVSPTHPDEFSFSVIHLLSAVRAALTTPLPVEHALSFGQLLDYSSKMINDKSAVGIVYYKEIREENLPFLDINQIVQRVRSKPGDSRILKCQEPLLELVKGVVKIFSWERLTVYDRLRKKWRWMGPAPCSLRHENHNQVDISYKGWGLLQENLLKLVNQFSIWLRRTQPILKLIASLPQPPRELMQQKDFHTRFNNRKRLNERTIGQSCNEIRAYFHREEAIRYLIPDRGFLYTSLDGKKSAVAPLRKNCSNKAFAKSRGHYIFKANRPPQFSLLSLVRDAAARLPGGMGTRADICDLIRDSQYVIENIPEKTVKQIVSGALDRLHCEVDPSVAYIGKWGLWVYLHQDREEEDFNEHGTSSMNTKESTSDAS